MDFYAETKRYLKQAGNHVWELTSPHVLYLSKEQAKAYTGNKDDPQYRKFHDETVKIIEEHANEIVAFYQDVFTLVDLGPEYPDKTLPIIHAAKAAGKKLNYVPVDINSEYLKIAEDAARPFVNRVACIQSMFEDCAVKIPDELRNNPLVFLGLTFMNYPPDKILKTLKTITGASGKIVVAAELLRPNNTPKDIEQHYKNDQVKKFVLSAALNLRLQPDDLEFDVRFQGTRAEVGFILKRNASTDLGMNAGDRLIVSVSYRYTKEALETLLKETIGRTALWTSKLGKTAVAFA